ncbi:MAG: peptidase M3, partial [Methyloligellaceae bacterium]
MTEQQNPLLIEWNTPFEIPPFDRIEHQHFEPAFEQALERHNREIQEIADNRDSVTFENTIDRLESSGELLRKVSSVFFNLCGTDTNNDLQKIESRMSPILARHSSEISLNPKL